ncbi:MAG: hypothetical protein IKQ87_04265 [Clostridia bacterium]|nr:hypothetical protein [Clostridia bacterium]
MLQEKLDLLIRKYDVGVKAEMKGRAAVVIDGREYPLQPHRFERRFTEIRKMLHDGTVTGVSAVRCGHVAPANVPLAALIGRELDLCRFFTGHEIVGVTAFIRDGRAATLLAEMDDGVVCSLEIANTLPAGAEHIDKHEIITARGLVCDRVVDTQIPQQSIYLYAGTNEAYTDVDFELYGLSAAEVAAVRCAFALAKDEGLREEALSSKATMDRLTACALESAKSGKRVSVN